MLFRSNIQPEVAKQKVKDAVDKAKSDLPNDLTFQPEVKEFSISEMPVLYVNVSGDFDGVSLKQYAERLQERFEDLKEITRADIVEQEVGEGPDASSAELGDVAPRHPGGTVAHRTGSFVEGGVALRERGFRGEIVFLVQQIGRAHV